MSGSSPSQSDPPPPPNLTQFLTLVEALCQQNETLQDSVHVLQIYRQHDGDTKEELLYSQPVPEAI